MPKATKINSKTEKWYSYDEALTLPIGTVLTNNCENQIARFLVIEAIDIRNLGLKALLMIINIYNEPTIAVSGSTYSNMKYKPVDEDYEISFKCSELK